LITLAIVLNTDPFELTSENQTALL
jgi:hypothetical protein